MEGNGGREYGGRGGGRRKRPANDGDAEEGSLAYMLDNYKGPKSGKGHCVSDYPFEPHQHPVYLLAQNLTLVDNQFFFRKKNTGAQSALFPAAPGASPDPALPLPPTGSASSEPPAEPQDPAAPINPDAGHRPKNTKAFTYVHEDLWLALPIEMFSFNGESFCDLKNKTIQQQNINRLVRFLLDAFSAEPPASSGALSSQNAAGAQAPPPPPEVVPASDPSRSSASVSPPPPPPPDAPPASEITPNDDPLNGTVEMYYRDPDTGKTLARVRVFVEIVVKKAPEELNRDVATAAEATVLPALSFENLRRIQEPDNLLGFRIRYMFIDPRISPEAMVKLRIFMNQRLCRLINTDEYNLKVNLLARKRLYLTECAEAYKEQQLKEASKEAGNGKEKGNGKKKKKGKGKGKNTDEDDDDDDDEDEDEEERNGLDAGQNEIAAHLEQVLRERDPPPHPGGRPVKKEPPRRPQSLQAPPPPPPPPPPVEEEDEDAPPSPPSSPRAAPLPKGAHSPANPKGGPVQPADAGAAPPPAASKYGNRAELAAKGKLLRSIKAIAAKRVIVIKKKMSQVLGPSHYPNTVLTMEDYHDLILRPWACRVRPGFDPTCTLVQNRVELLDEMIDFQEKAETQLGTYFNFQNTCIVLGLNDVNRVQGNWRNYYAHKPGPLAANGALGPRHIYLTFPYPDLAFEYDIRKFETTILSEFKIPCKRSMLDEALKTYWGEIALDRIKNFETMKKAKLDEVQKSKEDADADLLGKSQEALAASTAASELFPVPQPRKSLAVDVAKFSPEVLDLMRQYALLSGEDELGVLNGSDATLQSGTSNTMSNLISLARQDKRSREIYQRLSDTLPDLFNTHNQDRAIKELRSNNRADHAEKLRSLFALDATSAETLFESGANGTRASGEAMPDISAAGMSGTNGVTEGGDEMKQRATGIGERSEDTAQNTAATFFESSIRRLSREAEKTMQRITDVLGHLPLTKDMPSEEDIRLRCEARLKLEREDYLKSKSRTMLLTMGYQPTSSVHKLPEDAQRFYNDYMNAIDADYTAGEAKIGRAAKLQTIRDAYIHEFCDAHRRIHRDKLTALFYAERLNVFADMFHPDTPDLAVIHRQMLNITRTRGHNKYFEPWLTLDTTLTRWSNRWVHLIDHIEHSVHLYDFHTFLGVLIRNFRPTTLVTGSPTECPLKTHMVMVAAPGSGKSFVSEILRKGSIDGTYFAPDHSSNLAEVTDGAKDYFMRAADEGTHSTWEDPAKLGPADRIKRNRDKTWLVKQVLTFAVNREGLDGQRITAKVIVSAIQSALELVNRWSTHDEDSMEDRWQRTVNEWPRRVDRKLINGVAQTSTKGDSDALSSFLQLMREVHFVQATIVGAIDIKGLPRPNMRVYRIQQQAAIGELLPFASVIQDKGRTFFRGYNAALSNVIDKVVDLAMSAENSPYLRLNSDKSAVAEIRELRHETLFKHLASHLYCEWDQGISALYEMLQLEVIPFDTQKNMLTFCVKELGFVRRPLQYAFMRAENQGVFEEGEYLDIRRRALERMSEEEVTAKKAKWPEHSILFDVTYKMTDAEIGQLWRIPHRQFDEMFDMPSFVTDYTALEDELTRTAPSEVVIAPKYRQRIEFYYMDRPDVPLPAEYHTRAYQVYKTMNASERTDASVASKRRFQNTKAVDEMEVVKDAEGTEAPRKSKTRSEVAPVAIHQEDNRQLGMLADEALDSVTTNVKSAKLSNQTRQTTMESFVDPKSSTNVEDPEDLDYVPPFIPRRSYDPNRLVVCMSQPGPAGWNEFVRKYFNLVSQRCNMSISIADSLLRMLLKKTLKIHVLADVTRLEEVPDFLYTTIDDSSAPNGKRKTVVRKEEPIITYSDKTGKVSILTEYITRFNCHIMFMAITAAENRKTRDLRVALPHAMDGHPDIMHVFRVRPRNDRVIRLPNFDFIDGEERVKLVPRNAEAYRLLPNSSRLSAYNNKATMIKTEVAGLKYGVEEEAFMEHLTDSGLSQGLAGDELAKFARSHPSGPGATEKIIKEFRRIYPIYKGELTENYPADRLAKCKNKIRDREMSKRIGMYSAERISILRQKKDWKNADMDRMEEVAMNRISRERKNLVLSWQQNDPRGIVVSQTTEWNAMTPLEQFVWFEFERESERAKKAIHDRELKEVELITKFIEAKEKEREVTKAAAVGLPEKAHLAVINTQATSKTKAMPAHPNAIPVDEASLSERARAMAMKQQGTKGSQNAAVLVPRDAVMQESDQMPPQTAPGNRNSDEGSSSEESPPSPPRESYSDDEDTKDATKETNRAKGVQAPTSFGALIPSPHLDPSAVPKGAKKKSKAKKQRIDAPVEEALLPAPSQPVAPLPEVRQQSRPNLYSFALEGFASTPMVEIPVADPFQAST